MSQARSSAVHLQIRLLLILCLITLLTLAASRIYEVANLSQKIQSQSSLLEDQSSLLSNQQEQLTSLEEKLANTSLVANSPSSTEDAYRAMEDSSLPEDSLADGTGGGSDLPPSLPPGTDFGAYEDDLTEGQPNLLDESGTLPPPPVDPYESQLEIIQEQLQREQHIGLIAAVEEGVVAIEPLPGLDNELFVNDSVLVAREVNGQRELIGKFLISERQLDEQEQVFFIADLSQELGAIITKPVLIDDLVFILGAAQ